MAVSVGGRGRGSGAGAGAGAGGGAAIRRSRGRRCGSREAAGRATGRGPSVPSVTAVATNRYGDCGRANGEKRVK